MFYVKFKLTVIELVKWCAAFILFVAICKGMPTKIPTNPYGLCVMDEKESPIYVYPPLVVAPKSQMFLLQDGNWTVKKSTDSFQGPVTDKRWEDFEIKYTDNFRFLGETSIALSILADYDLEIVILLSDDFSEYSSIDIIRNVQWVHLGIIRRNGNVHIFRDGILIKETYDMNVKEIVIRSNKMAYWKLHEYDYSYSESIGSYDYTVADELGSCLMLYVSMCSMCFLQIRNDTIEPNNSIEIVLESWQHRKIKMNSDEEKEITLHKGQYDDSVQGYWAIDIRTCPITTPDKTILEITFPGTEVNEMTECRTLNNQKGEFLITVTQGLLMTTGLPADPQYLYIASVVAFGLILLLALLVFILNNNSRKKIHEPVLDHRPQAPLIPLLGGHSRVISTSQVRYRSRMDLRALSESNEHAEERSTDLTQQFDQPTESGVRRQQIQKHPVDPQNNWNQTLMKDQLSKEFAEKANNLHRWLTKICAMMEDLDSPNEQIGTLVIEIRKRYSDLEKICELGARLEEHQIVNNNYTEHSPNSLIHQWDQMVQLGVDKRLMGLTINQKYSTASDDSTKKRLGKNQEIIPLLEELFFKKE